MTAQGKWIAFGSSIRSARLARGLSMRSVATAVGISAPYVNELEKGRSRAGLDVVARLCEVLEIAFPEVAALLDYRVPVATLAWAVDPRMVDPDLSPDEIRHLQEVLAEMRRSDGGVSPNKA